MFPNIALNVNCSLKWIVTLLVTLQLVLQGTLEITNWIPFQLKHSRNAGNVLRLLAYSQ